MSFSAFLEAWTAHQFLKNTGFFGVRLPKTQSYPAGDGGFN
jgi:hypothetical protein